MAKPDGYAAGLDWEATGDRRLRLSALAAISLGPETQEYDNKTHHFTGAEEEESSLTDQARSERVGPSLETEAGCEEQPAEG